MREKMILLERSIQNDLRAITALYEQIGQPTLSPETAEEELIVVAYRLHNLYSAFENLLLRIARTFENEIEDQARWHTELLERMALDLTPIRPAVIDAEALDKLDELRRFRHLFRSAYTIRLDARRLALVLEKAWELNDLYKSQLANFLAFLKTFSESNG